MTFNFKNKKDFIQHGEAVGLGMLCEIYYSNFKKNDLYYRVEKILNQYSLITNLKDKLPKNTSKIEIQKKIFKNIFLDKKKIGVHPRYISLKKKYKPNIAEIDDMTKLNETIYNLLN